MSGALSTKISKALCLATCLRTAQARPTGPVCLAICHHLRDASFSCESRLSVLDPIETKKMRDFCVSCRQKAMDAWRFPARPVGVGGRPRRCGPARCIIWCQTSWPSICVVRRCRRGAPNFEREDDQRRAREGSLYASVRLDRHVCLCTGTYKIPSFNDVPIDFRVSLLKNHPNPTAIHSSKGDREANRDPPAHRGGGRISTPCRASIFCRHRRARALPRRRRLLRSQTRTFIVTTSNAPTVTTLRGIGIGFE